MKIVSTCDECHMTKYFDSETEQRSYGWRSKNNYVTCVACRLKKLEDVNCTKDDGVKE